MLSNARIGLERVGVGGTLRGPLTFTERLSASAPSGLYQPRENLLSSRYTGPQVESGDGRYAAYFNTSSFRVGGIGTRNTKAKAPAAIRLAAPGPDGRPPLVHPLTRRGTPGPSVAAATEGCGPIIFMLGARLSWDGRLRVRVAVHPWRESRMPCW
jgi:hypothetical protein